MSSGLRLEVLQLLFCALELLVRTYLLTQSLNQYALNQPRCMSAAQLLHRVRVSLYVCLFIRLSLVRFVLSPLSCITQDSRVAELDGDFACHMSYRHIFGSRK